jgi:hypothetical protein
MSVVGDVMHPSIETVSAPQGASKHLFECVAAFLP